MNINKLKYPCDEHLECVGYSVLGIRACECCNGSDNDADMCYHECPSCNNRCNCTDTPCSCCKCNSCKYVDGFRCNHPHGCDGEYEFYEPKN